METDKEQVMIKLRAAILKGYNPYYDYESACDHMVDWLVLTKQEFDTISEKAKKEREQNSQPVI